MFLIVSRNALRIFREGVTTSSVLVGLAPRAVLTAPWNALKKSRSATSFVGVEPANTNALLQNASWIAAKENVRKFQLMKILKIAMLTTLPVTCSREVILQGLSFLHSA